jgi:hypothetical protein
MKYKFFPQRFFAYNIELCEFYCVISVDWCGIYVNNLFISVN